MNQRLTQLLSLSFIIIFSFSHSEVWSQPNFENYQTLLCQGEMPFDFKASVSEKVEKDLELSKLSFASKTEAIEFWNDVHSELEEVLYSGNIIYGDEISLYVKNVASNLLKEDPELLKQLRFYTIKSNEVNAFSTAPGIIFVTTGLISQLSSEAQLAFILSHEIAHFEKNHVYNEYLNFKKSGKKRKRDEILKLSQFSKELEFEADELAIKRFHQLGYSSKELMGTFDILMYSYLPFDEITFPNNYFNTEQLYIPEKRIDKEIREITAREDYDDKFHTHPNIKKRKDSILSLLETYTNWGEIKFMLDEKQFHDAVNTCRFEDVRINLVQGNVFNALYSIFLLEKLDSKNGFLRRMEAVSWLSILQTENLIHKRFENPKIEGESSKLYQFLKQSKKVELATIGLRILYDLKTNYPDDPFLVTTYNTYVKELSNKSYFNLSKFQALNYHQAATASINKSNELKNAPKDTLENTSGDKYSRIKEKRSVTAIIQFDSTEYALYSLSDIIQDSLFQSDFKRYKSYNDSVDSALKAFNLLSAKEQSRIKNEQIKKQNQTLQASDLKEILIIDPVVSIYSEKKLPDWEIDRAQKNFLLMIRTLCSKNRFVPIIMKADSVAKLGTDALNEYSIYTSYLEQLKFTNEGSDCLPIDFTLVNTYSQKRGVSRILSSQIYYLKDYQSLHQQCAFVDLKTGDVHTSGIKQTKILATENYTPFFTDFFAIIRSF
jgi:beta-barrel assembly-enhancing protease